MKHFARMIIGILVLTAIAFLPVTRGFLIEQEDQERLKWIPTSSDTLIVGWRHSVERTPWYETYRVEKDHSLRLESSTYQSYGAGTPDREGKAELLEDGYVRVTEIERHIPYYTLLYAPISEYYVAVDDKKYFLKNIVDDYESVIIRHKTVRLYEWVILQVRGE